MMNNTKIAILTLYYKNYNYGGVLQAYALQRALNQLGYDAVQISYRLETGKENRNPVKAKIKKPLAYIYHLMKYGTWYKNYNLRRKKIEAFSIQIPHTEVVTASTITKLSDQYDCYICGSDQIWNPLSWQPTFFFDFLPENKKRIAYASSISRETLTEEEYTFISKYIELFTAVSVREGNSAKMLEQRFPESKVECMPDPVFLLDKTEWEKIANKKSSQDAYIFAYFLGKDNENREAAFQYAKEKGIKIIFSSHMNYQQYEWERTHTKEISAPLGVEEFLQKISNATLVLTDSFHAAAFSSIYRTPFFVLPRFKANEKNSMNSRIRNLVEELGIAARFTDKLEDDYGWKVNELENISSNIKRLQKKGKDFLIYAINSDK